MGYKGGGWDEQGRPKSSAGRAGGSKAGQQQPSIWPQDQPDGRRAIADPFKLDRCQIDPAKDSKLVFETSESVSIVRYSLAPFQPFAEPCANFYLPTGSYFRCSRTQGGPPPRRLRLWSVHLAQRRAFASSCSQC